MKALALINTLKSLIFNDFRVIMTHIKKFSAIISVDFARQFTLISLLFCELLLATTGFCQARNPYNLSIATRKKDYQQQADSNAMLTLVNLKEFIPALLSDVRYATSNNFTKQVLYTREGLFLRKKAANSLRLVNDSLRKTGLCLLVFDAYRPYATTLQMWKIVPDDRYAANPANGSGHNRGIAVDVTLADARTGIPLQMPTDYDNFSDTAHHNFPLSDSTVLANRTLLKNVMMHFGFVPLSTEWWHYSLPDAKTYPLMDFSFQQINRWLSRRWHLAF